MPTNLQCANGVPAVEVMPFEATQILGKVLEDKVGVDIYANLFKELIRCAAFDYDYFIRMLQDINMQHFYSVEQFYEYFENLF